MTTGGDGPQQLVSVDHRPDGVAIVEMGEPGSLNLWTTQLETELFAVLDDLSACPEVRVIGVVSRGRAFSAGTDLRAMHPLMDSTNPVSDDADVVLSRAVTRVLDTPKPVLAAVSGPCVGIGLSFALTCDIRIASSDAMFKTGYVQRGLVAEHGTSWLLPRIVGLGNALDLLMTSRPVDAYEARTIGLVTRIVEPHELRQTLDEIAALIARSASPRSVAVVKRQVYQDLENSFRSALHNAAYETVGARRSSDARERVASFLAGSAERSTDGSPVTSQAPHPAVHEADRTDTRHGREMSF